MLEKIAPPQRFQLIGDVVVLMASSSLHRKYRVGDIMTTILPPLDLGQFRLYKRQDIPVGLVTWAFLDESTENRFINEQYDLQLGDWQSGDRLWFIDFIANQDTFKRIKKDIETTVFPDQIGKALRANAQGEVEKVQVYYGVNVDQKKRGH